MRKGIFAVILICLALSFVLGCKPKLTGGPEQNDSIISNITLANNISRNDTLPTPNNITNLTPDVLGNISGTVNLTNSSNISSNPVNDSGHQRFVCHYLEKVIVGEPKIIQESDLELEIKLIDFKENEWAKFEINNKSIQATVLQIVKVDMGGSSDISVSVTVIRDNSAVICINTGKAYDISYCDSKEGSERYMCFDNLGYLNGIEYCEQITDLEDKAFCLKGVSGI